VGSEELAVEDDMVTEDVNAEGTTVPCTVLQTEDAMLYELVLDTNKTSHTTKINTQQLNNDD
jgi:hypothetical protein